MIDFLYLILDLITSLCNCDLFAQAFMLMFVLGLFGYFYRMMCL